jgi:hypothetical protein
MKVLLGSRDGSDAVAERERNTRRVTMRGTVLEYLLALQS